MLLLTHILIAITSVVVATSLIVAPSRVKLITSWMFITTTIFSGILLVILTNASVLHACASGLAFTSLSTTLSYYGHRKLLANESRV